MFTFPGNTYIIVDTTEKIIELSTYRGFYLPVDLGLLLEPIEWDWVEVFSQ